MSNYVQQMWESQPYANGHHGKATRVVAWVIGALAVAGIAAFATHDYWYPYLSSYIS